MSSNRSVRRQASFPPEKPGNSSTTTNNGNNNNNNNESATPTGVTAPTASFLRRREENLQKIAEREEATRQAAATRNALARRSRQSLKSDTSATSSPQSTLASSPKPLARRTSASGSKPAQERTLRRTKTFENVSEPPSPRPERERPSSLVLPVPLPIPAEPANTGIVAGMNPEPAVALQSTAKVFEAAAYMAAKRQDAVLIVDEDSHLVGILTDKDLAYRVVAEGLDAQTTLVSQVMTANPVSVTRSTTSTDALNKMIGGQFRHLPVVESDDENSDDDDEYEDDDDEVHQERLSRRRHSQASTAASTATGGGVVGVLDITKCLYTALEKLERAYESSRKLNEAIQGVEREWSIKSGSGSIGRYAEVLRDQLACPDLAGLLATQSASPPVIGVEGTIHEAAQKMRQSRETAVLVFDADEDGMGTLAGIFTSKDLTLRVLAAGLDPSTTLVSHVMTPHPDCVTPTTPVVEALRKMHAGKYLHLPVIDENGVVEGLVDVLKLTYTTLAQMTNVQGEPGEGPVWNKFWASGTGGAEAYDPFTDQIRLRGGHSEGRTNSLVDLEHEGDQEDGDDDKYSELSSHVLRTSLPSTFNFPDDSTVAPDDSASMSPRRTLNRRSLLLHSHNNSHHLAHNTSHHHGAAPSHLTPAPTTLSTTSTPLPPHLYTFKLTHPITHQTHRFTSPFDSLPTLRQIIARKLGVSAAQLGGLSYTDDEGDHVAVVDDEGLVDAVRMAAAGGWGRLVVNVELVGGREEGGDAGREGRREGRGMMSVLMGGGLAVACAFILGRSFR